MGELVSSRDGIVMLWKLKIRSSWESVMDLDDLS
jgi:hypothetical protein